MKAKHIILILIVIILAGCNSEPIEEVYTEQIARAIIDGCHTISMSIFIGLTMIAIALGGRK